MMLWLLLGAGVLFVFLGGLRAFETANVKTLKSLGAWILALGGLSLALLLILTGRGGIALGAIVLFGPLLWQQGKRPKPGDPSLSRHRPAPVAP
jgi:DnaJ family protein C protein 19